MQPEALRVWEKLRNRLGEFPDGTTRNRNELERQVVVGQFCATIDTVGNTANPVIMNASVGWSIPYRQQYDVDGTFREPITVRLRSTPNGAWMTTSGETITDEEIVNWQVNTLREWVNTNGRYATDDGDD